MKTEIKIYTSKENFRYFEKNIQLSEAEKEHFLAYKYGVLTVNAGNKTLVVSENIIQLHLNLLQGLFAVANGQDYSFNLMRQEASYLKFESLNNVITLNYFYRGVLDQSIQCDKNEFIADLSESTLNFIEFIKDVFATPITHLQKEISFLKERL